MTRSVDAAIGVCRGQSAHGPRFDVGMCKSQTREAYGVPSDGARDATEAWMRTDHRLDVDAGSAPAGALLWWTGGAHGHGHVAIKDYAPGWCWSVDFERPGYWDRVLIAQLSAGWSALRFAGVSRDIDGVVVVPPSRTTPALDRALRDLRHARDIRKPGPVRAAIRAAIRSVRSAKAGGR